MLLMCVDQGEMFKCLETFKSTGVVASYPGVKNNNNKNRKKKNLLCHLVVPSKFPLM